MLKPCNQDVPFLKASHFQSFEHRANGTIQLKGSKLCITLGKESAATFDPHAWRTYGELRQRRLETSNMVFVLSQIQYTQ